MKQRPIDAYALAGALCKFVGQPITLDDVLREVANAPTIKAEKPAEEKPAAQKKGAAKK